MMLLTDNNNFFCFNFYQFQKVVRFVAAINFKDNRKVKRKKSYGES